MDHILLLIGMEGMPFGILRILNIDACQKERELSVDFAINLKLNSSLMEAQILLLRAIIKGDEPPSVDNLRKAFNKEVLAERAVSNQNVSTEATLNALDSESEKLRHQIERRESQIKRLRVALEENLDESEDQKLSGFQPLQQMEALQDIIARLAEGHLLKLGIGPSEETIRVLWSLCQVTTRSEQLLVPADLQIVQYLIDEGLVRSEPVGRKKLRIRLY